VLQRLVVVGCSTRMESLIKGGGDSKRTLVASIMKLDEEKRSRRGDVSSGLARGLSNVPTKIEMHLVS
jgi:hypothetical protein